MNVVEVTKTNSAKSAVKSAKKVTAKRQEKTKGKKKAKVEAKVVQAVEEPRPTTPFAEPAPVAEPKRDIFGVSRSTQAGEMNATIVVMIEKGKDVDGESLRKALEEKYSKKRVDSHVAWMRKHNFI
jgi:hypothetical protein